MNRYKKKSYRPAIKKRIFIVGCPRSGTTLLQGMLAAHPDVYSLPETYFFSRALVSKNPFKNYMLWPAIKVRKHFENIVREAGGESLCNVYNIGIFQSDYYRPFVDFMDDITMENKKNIWVEKTPMHLYCVSEIQKRIPDACIIHMVRNGLDVVDSLVRATQDNPQQWARFGGWRRKFWKGFSVDDAIKIWNHDFNITKSRLAISKDILVKYEDLISDPFSSLLNLCQELDITYSDRMIHSDKSFGSIVREDEIWKINNKNRVLTKKINSRYKDHSKKIYIESKLDSYDV